MITKLKLYESSSFNPYLNLAIEEYLLKTLESDTFILYLWQNENTVVIGRNQNPLAECNLSELFADGGNLARRKSGGGAVFHDKGNLNFTFISKGEDFNITTNIKIIEKACKMAGIITEVSGRNDITANEKKFSGNAFYNTSGKSLHHGTLLINTSSDKLSKYLTPSTAKLEAKGIKSVRSRVVNLSELSPSLSTEKMKEFMLKAAEGELKLKAERITQLNEQEVVSLEKEYSNDKWIFSATPPFTVSYSGHFNWGNAELLLNIEKSIIKSVGFYTDSLDHTLSDKIKSSLIGVRFNKNDIESVLPIEIAQDILSIIKL